ncbi:MAG: hypothetical protein RR140_02050 [Clostridia bacterium]
MKQKQKEIILKAIRIGGPILIGLLCAFVPSAVGISPWWSLLTVAGGVGISVASIELTAHSKSKWISNNEKRAEGLELLTKIAEHQLSNRAEQNLSKSDVNLIMQKSAKSLKQLSDAQQFQNEGILPYSCSNMSYFNDKQKELYYKQQKLRVSVALLNEDKTPQNSANSEPKIQKLAKITNKIDSQFAPFNCSKTVLVAPNLQIQNDKTSIYCHSQTIKNQFLKEIIPEDKVSVDKENFVIVKFANGKKVAPSIARVSDNRFVKKIREMLILDAKIKIVSLKKCGLSNEQIESTMLPINVETVDCYGYTRNIVEIKTLRQLEMDAGKSKITSIENNIL